MLDYETLAKRLLGAMHYGIRIEQESGHRWIQIDLEADNLPSTIRNKFYSPHREPDDSTIFSIKEYGSFKKALDTIDALLKEADCRSLLEVYKDLDYYDDESTIFSEEDVA